MISVTFDASNPSFRIDAVLSVSGNYGAQISDPDDALIGLTLPAGYSFTSASGVFGTDVAAVPEPGSALLLLMAGLGALGIRRR